jgi:uncharacterized protein
MLLPAQFAWFEPVLIASILVFIIDLVVNWLSFKNAFLSALVNAIVFVIVFGGLVSYFSVGKVSLSVMPRTSAIAAAQTQGRGGGADLANPAAVNCVDKLGGEIKIVDTAKGQAGYCHLKDGRVCEEWALFRDGSCVAP